MLISTKDEIIESILLKTSNETQLNNSYVRFFSVIIPAFNAEKFIYSCIESVLNQTFQDFELIICDNASTDGTSQIIKQFAGQIKIITLSENIGPAGGRNAGIEASSGHYVALLDADDVWEPEKLDKYYKLIKKTGTNFVFSKFSVFSDDTYKGMSVSPRKKTTTFPIKDPLLLVKNYVPCSSVTINREIISSRPFNEEVNIRTTEDHLLWIQLNQNHTFSYIDEPLTKYRIHSEQSTNSVRTHARYFRYLQIVEDTNLFEPWYIGYCWKVINVQLTIQNRQWIKVIPALLKFLLISINPRFQKVSFELITMTIRRGLQSLKTISKITSSSK
ncbi:MAG: hypothetical protein CL780_06545 [Chloroflexi bacterium]|nr:hypothetical protein [Chloroflexota bacterium]|tara:strand:- start:15267 stop:16262 length:996 start_codon:yes stop_codon:yes gene_type:complete